MARRNRICMRTVPDSYLGNRTVNAVLDPRKGVCVVKSSVY